MRVLDRDQGERSRWLLVVGAVVLVLATSACYGSDSDAFYEGSIENDSGDLTSWSARITSGQTCTEIEDGPTVCADLNEETLKEGEVVVMSSPGGKVGIAGATSPEADQVVIEFSDGSTQETAIGPVIDGRTPFAWALSSSVGPVEVTIRAYLGGSEVASKRLVVLGG
jgi:hypothetical protein